MRDLAEDWGKDEGVGRLWMWVKMARSCSLACESRRCVSLRLLFGSGNSMEPQIQHSVSGLRERSTYAAENDGGG